MANPYDYYPQGGMLQPAIQIADTATRLYGIREHSRLSEGEQALRSRGLDIQQQQANTTEQWRLAEAEKMRANTPIHKQEFRPSVLLQSQAATRQAYGDAGLKAFDPMFQAIKEVAVDPRSTYGDIYKSAMSIYPQKREEMMGTLEKQLMDGKLTPEQQKQIQKVYDAIAYDQTGERILGMGVFKNTADSMKAEEANSKANIEGIKQEGYNQRLLDRLDANQKIAEAKIEAAGAKAAAAAGNKNQLTINDIKTAYGMEMTGIKNRMLADMTPEEQTNFANMAPEQLMAALLAGGGKNLPPEKKNQYIGEMQAVENYYGGLTQNLLGRKGAQPKQPKPVENPSTGGVNANEPQAVQFLKGAKTRDQAKEMIRQLAEQGWKKDQLAAIAAKAGWE